MMLTGLRAEQNKKGNARERGNGKEALEELGAWRDWHIIGNN